MENKVKEWSVGSYVVFIKEGYMGSDECLKNNSKSTIGFVGEISHYYGHSSNLTAIKNNPIGNYVFEKYLVKWFATLQEAEIFSKNLIMKEDSNINLKEFPLEGCVYENVNKLDSLVKYLLNRPLNRADGKILKSEAIGIAWNKTSCWWLKTGKSEKPLFKLSDLNKFLSSEILNNNIPEYIELLPHFDSKHTGEIFNTKNKPPEYDRWNYNNWEKLLKIHGQYFKQSTKEAYETQFKQYPLTKEECYSSEIEVGDEVSSGNLTGIVIGIKNEGEHNYLIKHNNGFKGHQGHPRHFTLLKGNYSDKNDSWYYALSSLKLIKKTSQITNSVKKVLSSSPEVRTTNEIYIPKITKIKPKVDFTITNNTFAEIKFNHSVKPKKVVKPIIIEKFQLFI